ncbi:hypothetical protein PACTADRAFT_5317 [Pachysolen tannophilus NRRL Y-2460]|uniref:Pyridoxamine kinase/Phosphomethylpyrimidine kinase domain-containing protein n=1 Tax=Pachysolen tannophilus NRRL Y-2460 TaxID=669874 RepID=A0A1E4TP94_PACTA|nr:hypothetical protein PACTADRAFT_5317 [Pachysolen tannophilus NRRL Y-2460]
MLTAASTDLKTIDLTNVPKAPFIHNQAVSDRLPTVLTVAGSDSSGGAGIEADLKTITSHKCYGLTCINSLTAQNTIGVNDSFQIPFEFLIKILDANFKDIDIDVIKTGMLTVDCILALKETILKYGYSNPLVIDPVMVSTSGYELTAQKNIKLLIEELFPYVTLITPNFIEATTILSIVDTDFESEENKANYYKNFKANTVDDIFGMCFKLSKFTKVKNVLLKGGHIPWKDENNNDSYITDVLYQSDSGKFSLFKSNFSNSQNTHGTGCTLASSIASNLAKKLSLVDAIGNAINYVQNGITHSGNIGHGHGPLNHCYAISRKDLEFDFDESFIKIPFEKGEFLQYLINHPSIKDVWNDYIHHKFIHKVADLSLPKSHFLNFLKQDSCYLLNYARVHSLASSIAPDISSIEMEAQILLECTTEVDKHTAKLAKLGISAEELSLTKMNQACQNYNNYLMNIGKNEGDWLEINIALAPCLHGYKYASIFGQSIFKGIIENDDKSQLFNFWLQEYTSEEYLQACTRGDKIINDHCFNQDGYISLKKLEKLIKIFKDVTELEIKFWDEFL